jgi:hypothetical protein
MRFFTTLSPQKLSIRYASLSVCVKPSDKRHIFFENQPTKKLSPVKKKRHPIFKLL